MGIASGEFICFIDSDDWIERNFLLSLYMQFDEETDVVISKNKIFDAVLNRIVIRNKMEWDYFEFEGEEKEKYIEQKHLGPSKNRNSEKFNDTIMCVWKNMYRLSQLRKHNITFVSERLIMLEDYHFNMRAYHVARKVKVCNSTEYVYNMVYNSLSKSYRPNYLEMIKKLHNECNSYIESTEYYDPEEARARINRFMAKSLVDIAYNFYYSSKVNKNNAINQLCNDSYVKELMINTKKMDIPFYYKFFLYLIRKKRISVLSISLACAKKIYILYRIYKTKWA